ncbi:MAG: outer membrane beta-barrel protein [Spirochaetes bacterium]|nr:outer membrane beta-barrel protein [Spirochaetota bacterium]
MKHLKIYFFIILIIAFVCCYTEVSYAIGEFSIGINTGMTYDPNNLGDEISRANQYIADYRENNTGAEGEEINVPYALLLGCNLKYHFNYLLFRFAGYFAKPGAGVEGSYTPPGGPENEIKISTYQASFPLSIAFLLPLKERTFFYFGGGMTYHIASVKITQSNPDPAFPVLGTDRMDKYTGSFTGWHLLVGAEVPLLDKYSISVEWIHQEGRSSSISNDGIDINGNGINTPGRQINTRGDFILFGINYYISI